jgi:hypothetical protein
MKRHLILVLAAAAAITFGRNCQAQAVLTDLTDGLPPNTGPYDVYMTDETPGSVGQPPGLNYYSNGSGAGGNPGQIFTTGSNPNGYTLNSVAFLTDGGGGDNITTIGQTWYLRIYSYNSATSNATLVATYPSQNNFTFSETDWLQFTNLGAGLSPNSTYAYTIQNGGSGWEAIGAELTTLYTAGQAVLIPKGGGQLTAAKNFSTASGWQADFVVGLAPITGIVVNPPVIVTPGNIYPTTQYAYATNTAVEIDCGVVLGAGPFTYKWQTDGGTGGSLAPITGGTTQNIVVNAATSPGVFQYNVVVSNGSISVTSAVVSLQVAYPTAAASLADEGSSYVASPFYPNISQLTSGGTGDSLNYYFNNPSAPGQTFTTGTNALGYTINSLQIQTDPTSSQSGIGTGQPYYLYIYKVNTNTGEAQILQAYTNANFTFNLGDWLIWSGLPSPVTLAPNSVYAYTFANNNPNSYAGLACSSTNNYTGGQLIQVDPASGAIIFDGTDPLTNNSCTFYLSLSAVGQNPPQPVAGPITVSPASGAPGTTFTVSETASGQAPLSYYWWTDNGTGGAFTAIPGNNISNLVLNTTGWNPGVYSYQVIVSNATSVTSTSGVAVVTVALPSTSASGVLTDIGANPPTPGTYDITQTNGVVGGNTTTPTGLNYYIDNNAPPGETFTTGSNPNGYVLNSAAVQLGTDDFYAVWPVGGQPYFLNIYNVVNGQGGQYAQLAESITSQTNFVLTVGVSEGHWLQWTGLAVNLKPNTEYAYSFGKVPGDAGYINLFAASNTPAYYSGGQVALLPMTLGKIKYSTASGWNGTFDLGLALGTAPVSLHISNVGGGQLQVQWTGGLLEQSSVVNGSWTTNVSSSPYTFTPTGSGQFFRVLKQ